MSEQGVELEARRLWSRSAICDQNPNAETANPANVGYMRSSSPERSSTTHASSPSANLNGDGLLAAHWAGICVDMHVAQSAQLNGSTLPRHLESGLSFDNWSMQAWSESPCLCSVYDRYLQPLAII